MELLKKINPFYKESRIYFTLLSNLAYYKNHIGEYEQTPEILSELIDIEEKLGITEHDDIMLLFAETYTLLGKYEEATRIYNELYERIIQDENRFTKEYSTIADGMFSLYENLGDYDKSLFYAIESYKSSNDISTKGYELSQIGNIHYKLGNFKKAIEYLDMAIDTETKVYGQVTSVKIYHIKGEIYYKTKNYEEALRQYILAKENIETQLGIENLNYAETLISIAKIYIKFNGYQTATHYRNQAKEIIYKLNSGSKKYNYISALCAIDYDLNDEASLKEDFQTVTDNYTKIIKTNFQNLSANERSLFWENYKDWFEEQAPKFAYTYNAQEFSTNAYNSILISKGLLLNSEIEFNNIIQESGDTIALKMYKELHALKLLINKLRENPVSQLYTNIDSLEQIAQKQEKVLVERSKDYGDYTQNLVITWPQVQSKLGKKDVAIEFVSFPLNADSIMYIAYVLRKGWQFPKIVKLFEEKQLKNIDTQQLYTSNQASQLVWQPLKEFIEGAENVYFSPGGELYNIAIESLPDYNNANFLLNSQRKYYRLSSTREIALAKSKNKWKNATVYGGLKYGMDIEALIANNQRFTRSVDIDIPYDFITDSTDIDRGSISLPQYLPATKTEADEITKSLIYASVNTTEYTDTIGTEASFKSLSGQKTNVIHIGTHGFFSKEKRIAIEEDDLLFRKNENRVIKEDKSMTRSGLYFSGVNNILCGTRIPENVDDGKLTALEIAYLDLRGLDLVVLSACQTGLGEITGDGVFGLQRGFKKAGAQTLMMSLWKVDDEATGIFMTRFFANLDSTKSMTKQDAFLEAQDYLRNFERNGTKPFAKPEYWAAFIILDGIE